MQAISELLVGREIPTKKIKVLNARQEIIKKFVEVLNPMRIQNGYSPYPPSYIAMRMYRSGYGTDSTLMMLFGSCRDAINFSACWHTKTKVKKDEQ